MPENLTGAPQNSPLPAAVLAASDGGAGPPVHVAAAPPASAAPAPPAGAPAKPSPLDDYGIDASWDPEFDLEPEATPKDKPADPPAAAAPTTPPSGAPGQPRDPQTGQFLPKPESHPDWLLQQAFALGVPSQQAQSVPREQLEGWVIQQRQAQQQVLWSQQRQPAAAAQPPEPDPLQIDEAAWDPHFAKWANGVRTQLAQQRQVNQQLVQLLGQQGAQVQQHLAALAQQQALQQQAAVNQHAAAFRDRFAGMVSANESLKGKEQDVLRYMDAVRTAGIPGGEKEHFDAALKMMGLAAAEPAAEPELLRRKEAWDKGAVASPTRRAGLPEPKGERKAMKAAQSWLKNNMDESRDGDVLDGFKE